jgi:hypothetical protein
MSQLCFRTIISTPVSHRRLSSTSRNTLPDLQKLSHHHSEHTRTRPPAQSLPPAAAPRRAGGADGRDAQQPAKWRDTLLEVHVSFTVTARLSPLRLLSLPRSPPCASHPSTPIPRLSPSRHHLCLAGRHQTLYQTYQLPHQTRCPVTTSAPCTLAPIPAMWRLPHWQLEGTTVQSAAVDVFQLRL